jgi:hypothetical protein
VLAATDTRCLSCGATTPVRSAIRSGVLLTPEQSLKRRRRRAFAAVVFGLMLLGAGAAVFPNPNKEDAPAGPKKVTANDLAKIQNPSSLSNPWVVYVPERVSETGLKVVRNRLDGKQETRARYVLAPVGDRWLLAEVEGDFTGVRLEGQLQVWQSPMSKEVLQKVGREFPDKRLLPYQLSGETGFAKGVRMNSTVGLGLAGFGLLVFVCGLAGFFVRPRAG